MQSISFVFQKNSHKSVILCVGEAFLSREILFSKVTNVFLQSHLTLKTFSISFKYIKPPLQLRFPPQSLS